jgi:hypothetical protein
MADNPPSKRVYFFGLLRVCMALEGLLCSSDDVLPKHQSVLRATHTLNNPKIISACLGVCHPSIQCVSAERKASCRALGGHLCRQRPWLAMVVLVIVGHWRLMSDQPIVGIVKIVCGSIFFYSYIEPIHY